MGTHAMIGVVNENGSVEASYVHYDGYLEGAGRTLVECYDTQELANMVAKGGYISSLSESYAKSRLNSVHSNPPVMYSSVQEFMNEGYNYAGAEYLYLFDGEAWYFASVHDQPLFEEVEMNLKETA